MEGNESEAIFDSLNLNPQLFVNEVLNTIDDVVDDAFAFFYQEASGKLNSESRERCQDLRKGADHIRNVVQTVLDKRLAIWEKYCLRHCFSVPQGFVMPKRDDSTENDCVGRALSDPEIDSQLQSLRKKLTEVGIESEMLNQEFQALQRQHTSNEIVTTASELGKKIGNLKTSIAEGSEQMNTNGISNHRENPSAKDYAKGLSNLTFEDLQGFSIIMKGI